MRFPRAFAAAIGGGTELCAFWMLQDQNNTKEDKCPSVVFWGVETCARRNAWKVVMRCMMET